MKKTIAGTASALAVIAVIAVAGCSSGGTTTVKEIPAAAAPVTRTPAPAKPSPVVAKTVTAKPAPAVTKTVTPAAAPAPAPVSVGQAGDPWSVISEYYADIESGDYIDAWNQQSPGFQAANGSFASWEAGYQYTGAQSISENWESGGTVSISLSAVDNNAMDDPTQYFSCEYTVNTSSGLITGGSCTQTGQS
jgi:hypothetical protein